MWGDYQPITYNEFYKALAQTGGQFFNAAKTAATFSSPQGIKAANWLIGKSGTVMPTVADGAGTADFDTNLFKSGKLAMAHRYLGVQRPVRSPVRLGRRRRTR
ncbi:hypothetical protein [Nakamurella sp. PAMC28650]|uniref:hypothetical protein n=1 Tax=Nakamurella sp. PAMC28650 TaxID=2762325 RepID=UPI00164E0791|nr:hypothetical protein [Nakamurella sp. PAMC28650]QNK80405.1 hypothetical protein H7F38_19785 [Nakamurella sp. PAMC28650]